MRYFVFIMTFLAGFLPVRIWAQRTMTLQKCLKEAFEHNLALKEGKATVDKAELLQKTAVDLGNTTLSLSQDPTSGGSPDNSWSVSQDFSFPTVYKAKRRVLKSETALRETELKVVRHDVVKEVTMAYYALLHNRDIMKIYEEQDTIYHKFLDLASNKYKMGDASQLEKLNAERLYRENKLTWHQVEKNYQEAQLVLQRWMGTDEEVQPADTAFSVIAAPLSGHDYDFDDTPWFEVYERQRQLDEDNLTLEKQGFLPALSISLSSQLVLKGFNPYNVDRSRFDKGNFMGFEVGVSFPLFFGAQKARVKAARLDATINQLKLQQAGFQMRNQYQQAVNEYNRARKSLDYYVKEGNPEADRMLRLSRISYEKGEIGYVEYIQNLQTVADIHLQYANALNTYNQSVILLNYLKGNE